MNLFLKPALDAAGDPLLVRDPMTLRPLAKDGEWKTNAPYWIRRMRDKEVIDATASASAASPVASIEPPVDPVTASPSPIAPTE